MKKQVIAVILLVIAAVSFADTNISAKNQEDFWEEKELWQYEE